MHLWFFDLVVKSSDLIFFENLNSIKSERFLNFSLNLLLVL